MKWLSSGFSANPQKNSVFYRPKETANFSWVEFYAGQAEATRMFNYGGFRTAKLDLVYMKSRDAAHQNPMDLTSDAGMGWLDRNP